MKHLLCPLLFFLVAIPFFSWAQAPKTTKQVVAGRTVTAPKLDGLVDEALWQQVPPATDFVQNSPDNGSPARQRSEVRVLYDDDAIYIGAQLFDTAPDSILLQLSQRDRNQVNADMFGVYFDTYLDKQNAFGFEVSAAGVQTDLKITSNGDELSWDAVWESAVARHPQGWSVELRIPYAALRFPNRDVQTWGINFWRSTRRYREMAFWSFIDSAVQGFANQFGELTGIQGLKAPVRLSLMPYLSAYADHFPHNREDKKNLNTTLNGGMDIKYGLNDAFTLDMTLVPDFGQAQSDAQILNLSPFEVQFNENRQFFTEGTELFNKAGLFYSRRIGGRPIRKNITLDDYAPGTTVVENPERTNLVNASKLSGRTNKGLGIGLFNAITRATYATLQSPEGNTFKVLTDPMTNYSVLVLDQSLPYGSFLTFTNTNVTRGAGFHNANVTGLMTRLANKKNSYALNLRGNLSQHYHKGEVTPGTDKVELGHAYYTNFGKTSGNFQFNVSHSVESHTYNINDLGFLSNNNNIRNSANVRYNIYKPFWKLNNLYNTFGMQHRMLYKPGAFTELSYFLQTNATTKNFISFGYTLAWLPYDSYDYFEPRSFRNGVPDRKWRSPSGWEIGGYISSDYRKKFALDINSGSYRAAEYNQRITWIGFSPRMRVNDHLQVVFRTNYDYSKRDFGYAGPADLDAQQDSIGYGARNIHTVNNTLTGTYIFNARTALNLNMRHYWSSAVFHEYFLLLEDGNLQPLGRKPNSPFASNRNYNAFNIDLVYSWRFAPGSDISIVWKNAIEGHLIPDKNTYSTNLWNTLQAKQLNSFSVKILYYLDYQVIKRAFKS